MTTITAPGGVGEEEGRWGGGRKLQPNQDYHVPCTFEEPTRNAARAPSPYNGKIVAGMK
ncbi:MAG: hypothetical protein BJ554DRAFT_5111 [Olpidium bornovanus]|uniref:Uncharacterized protein n=1 Tax=Olpidium bornovanus TaxID=278681 RepID=A0A8H8DDQ6_9FUNG|nr:MAG: hypothetical protein BJ554DRAFT_5111 [Olpidium bornovanus]